MEYGNLGKIRSTNKVSVIAMIIEILTTIITAILSSLLGINYPALKDIYTKFKILSHNKKQQDILSEKIEKLTESLHNSSVLMSEIESEFEKQKELSEKWIEEAKNSQLIASLKKDEVDAISKLFGGQIEKANKKTGYKSIIWNVIFCILGIVGGYLTSKYL